MKKELRSCVFERLYGLEGILACGDKALAEFFF
jgi:hypothetical protein